MGEYFSYLLFLDRTVQSPNVKTLWPPLRNNDLDRTHLSIIFKQIVLIVIIQYPNLDKFESYIYLLSLSDI